MPNYRKTKLACYLGFITQAIAAMFALLAMAGDLGGSLGPAVVGKVTQYAGDDIRAGMGVGLIFPVVLIIMLIIMSRRKNSIQIRRS